MKSKVLQCMCIYIEENLKTFIDMNAKRKIQLNSCTMKNWNFKPMMFDCSKLLGKTQDIKN